MNFLVGRQFVAVVAKLSLKQQSVIDINLKLFSKELLFNMSNLENMTVSLILKKNGKEEKRNIYHIKLLFLYHPIFEIKYICTVKVEGYIATKSVRNAILSQIDNILSWYKIAIHRLTELF